MSVPRRMQEFAALYGCTIIEKPTLDDGLQADWLFATHDGKEEPICRSYYGNHVGLNNLKDILQRVSGRTLAQFWTHKTGEEVVQEVQANKQSGMKKKEQP